MELDIHELISFPHKLFDSSDKKTKDCQCPQALGRPLMNNELYIYNYSSRKCIFLCGVNGTVHHSQMQILQFSYFDITDHGR